MLNKFLLSMMFCLSAIGIQAQTVTYVTNNTSIQNASTPGNTVSVIDVASNMVTATIQVGNGPTGVAFSPNGTQAYVTNLNDGTISVISTSGNQVAATIDLGSSVQPALLAITPDGKSLYVPDQNNGNVLVVSTATNTATAIIPVVPGAFSVSITPDGSTAYVLSQTGGGVSVIDTASNTVSTTISVAALSGFNLVLTPNGSNAFVAGGLFQTIPIIATSSDIVTNSIFLPNSNFAFFLALTPNGSSLYASNGNENSADPNTVLMIDTATDAVSSTPIQVGAAPAGLAVTPDGQFVYVANNGDNTVSVIATATNTVVGSPIPVGVAPFSVGTVNLPTPGTVSSITANFNGTAIPAGDALWFSSVTKVSGVESTPVNIFVRQARITFTANGTATTVSVPDANLTFNPQVTTATTSFNTAADLWQTVVPARGLAGNVFLDGTQLMLPNGLPGGIKNVTWTASFSTDTPGIRLNWQWAAAAYSSLGESGGGGNNADLSDIWVKPVDDNKASEFQNSDHAGTPENYKQFVVGGGTGGGGSNFTGSYSGTKSVAPAVVQ